MSNEKIEAFWRKATEEDVAKIANTRKPIPARFRDEETEDWLDCLLVGWKLSKHLPGARWIDADGAMWNQCQVYEEPSWWLNRPDPGPGWRLLGKFPDELKKIEDEWFYAAENRWISVWNGSDEPQSNETWYRRRIEPVEAEPKHYVLRVGDSANLPNGQTITVTAKGFEVEQ